MSAYALAKRAWTGLLPDVVRDAIWRCSPRSLRSARMRLARRLARTAPHDDIYDAAYYDRLVEPTMAGSAALMADVIVRDLAPRTVADVGCGTGALLAALAERGIRGVGLEQSRAALDRCAARGVVARRHDIERDPIPADLRADVAISTEVAEHLPESCADRFVDLLAALAGRVVLTAAEPSIGSADHVNEQPTAYWIDKLAARGLRLDAETTARWRRDWAAAGVAPCFHRTVMVFVPGDSA